MERGFEVKYDIKKHILILDPIYEFLIMQIPHDMSYDQINR